MEQELIEHVVEAYGTTGRTPTGTYTADSRTRAHNKCDESTQYIVLQYR